MENRCPKNYDAVASDHWRDDTWGKNSTFPVMHRKPHTCSYCGGAKPRDVLDLMSKGWEVEATDKKDKRYLHPPGYLTGQCHVSGLVAQGRMPSVPAIDPVETAIPCVKVYISHFTPDEVDEFNRLLAKQSSY